MDGLELSPEKTLQEPEKKGFWKKLKRGLLMTHTELAEKIEAAVEGKTALDDETLEYLEESLIGADLGVEASLELVERLKLHAKKSEMGDIVKLREILFDEISILLLDAPPQGCRCTAYVTGLRDLWAYLRRGNVIPVWCMYLPARSEYATSHSSSDS